MNKTDKFRVAEILAEKVLGEISPGEQAELDSWVAQSPENGEVYKRFISGESYRSAMAVAERLDTTQTVARVERKVKRIKRKAVFRRAASVAAVLAAGVFAAVLMRTGHDVGNIEPVADIYEAVLTIDGRKTVLLTGEMQEREWQNVVAREMEPRVADDPQAVNIRVEVPRGKQYKLQLKDGTTVWLNAETMIEYPDRFDGAERRVSLSGEAFFEVAHDSDHPFIVTTQDGMEVTVLGTKFNVQSYTDETDALVSLQEGSVEVSYDESSVILSPNQQAVLNRNHEMLSVRQAPNSAAAWTNGVFDYDGQPVATVLDAVARWYDLTVVYEDPGKTHAGHVTLQADRREDFATVLDMLCKVSGMSYRIADRTVYVKF